MYKPTIGLEIHAELSTRTKMFCRCLNMDSEEPNKNVCPICLAHPGTLPTINHEAVEAVLKLGLALKGKTPPVSKFDRKNYFYPDLPKGYQISQYDLPLVVGGKLAGVKITRVHLEEDTGRLQHGEDGSTYVDFNRAGRALMELVTDPVVQNAEEALVFARELQLMLRYLDISDADMECGLMRVEANISISKDPVKPQGGQGASKLGTKVEVKNLNSFRAVAGAIAYEIKRQEEVLESGGKVVQETRGWDDVKAETYTQRVKEEAHDYRYLPEPDLPQMKFMSDDLEKLRAELPELPEEKRVRFMKEFKLKREQADLLVSDRWLAAFFEETVSELEEEEFKAKDAIGLAFNYLTSDLIGKMAEARLGVKEIKITPENFADLIKLIVSGQLNSRSAKEILAQMFKMGGDPHEFMKSGGMTQISDESELMKIVNEIIAGNPNVVGDYKKGKLPALEALIGRAMGKLKGTGNPEVLRRLFVEELK